MAKNKDKNTTPETTTTTTAATMPAMPKLPKMARKAKTQKPCVCGCGTMTGGKFAPGHDARVHAWALRVERGIVKLDGPELANFPVMRDAIKAHMDSRAAKVAKAS